MSDSEPKSRPTISAFLVCCNEQKSIRRCLESVKWCDEIVIVDSGSTDDTLNICREYTDQIHYHPWEGFVKQKRLAISYCTSDWVLNLDADEEVSPELAAEISETLSNWSPQSGVAGYDLLRVVFHLKRWWRKGGWYPEYRLRLCLRAKTTWGGYDPHERAEVDGEVLRLRGELRHYTYDNLEDQIRTLNSHSSSAALTLVSKGKRFGFADLIFRPIGRFLKFYVFRRGFLEGRSGLLVAMIEAFYVFIKYAKAWEKRLDNSLDSKNEPS